MLRALELVPLALLVMLCQSTRSVQIAVSAHGSARHACRTFATGCIVPQLARLVDNAEGGYANHYNEAVIPMAVQLNKCVAR